MREIPLHLPKCLMLMALMSLLGCSKPTAPSVSAEGARAKTYVIGVCLSRIDDPWQAQVKADLEAAAAKRPELQLVIQIAEKDAAKQQSQIEEFCNNRVNLIIIRPVEAQALTAPVAKAFDAGIPVIVLDRAVIGDKYTCLIAPDYRQIGVAAGKWLAGRLQGKGIIVELQGPVDSLPDKELHAGFRSELRNPGYRFAFDGHIDPPRTDAAKLMSEALGRIEKINAVFAYDDAAVYAAYQTAKTAGREKDVVFVGVGGLPNQGAAYVTEGVLGASFLLPTGGAEAIAAAAKLLHGQQAPKKIVPPTSIITKQ